MMRGGGGDFASGEDRYVPFDVENGSSSLRGSVDDDEDDIDEDDDNHSAFSDYHESPRPVSKNGAISEVNVLKTLFFILVWYSVSLFLTLYNKTLLGDHLGKFPAPLLMNTVHFAMQAVLSKAITGFWSQRFQPTVMMSWRDYSLKVVPTALTTAMDVNLSNASLVFISVTFATMVGVSKCKAAGDHLGHFCWDTINSYVWVSLDYDSDSSAGLKNPLTLMSYVTPVMALSTAFLSLVFDPWHEFGHTNYFDSSWHIARSCMLMLFGGTLAFFMVLTEYILVSITSAVTVTIAGVVKEAVTILVAVFYFHDDFTWMKGVGLLTIMFGVSLFNWYKYDKLQKGSTGEDEIGSPLGNAAAKYVILEEMEDQEHCP
ncbi:hypothetical protein RND71_004723 [Anisodus tanguticus]|uniref:Sugar phosphate transporter domain-containing protein n=1 Tax=Anisodus tanguticus TaxID=243964 RepID=A0AAE1SSR6_9SOLA|nr:hypothetical protein RND71_004723 [Anisodus tanguticus]